MNNSSTGFIDMITARYMGKSINSPRSVRNRNIATVPPIFLPARLFVAFSFAVLT